MRIFFFDNDVNDYLGKRLKIFLENNFRMKINEKFPKVKKALKFNPKNYSHKKIKYLLNSKGHGTLTVIFFHFQAKKSFTKYHQVLPNYRQFAITRVQYPLTQSKE